MRTVHTNDGNERNEFKNRLQDKINAALDTAIRQNLAPAPKKLKVDIPVNFSELGEAYIHQYLLNSKLTAEQSREICGFLFADQQTETFELEVVITSKQSKPAIETVETPKETKTLSLELPHKFNELSTKDQYLWLAKQSKLGLSLEEVNDVIEIVAGQAPKSGSGTQYEISFCQYELPAVTYEPSPKKKKANLRPGAKVKPKYALETEEFRTHIPVTLPENFSELKEYERHSVLINTFQLFADEATDILRMYRESGETEFTVFRPEPEQTTVTASAPKDIDLVLPYGFLTVTDAHKYKYLQTLLPPAQAQEAMAVLNGTPQATDQKFNISYSKEIVQEGNPIEEFIIRRRENLARIKADYAGYELATDGYVRSVKVQIPEVFSSLPSAEQQRYLTTTFKLFPGEASEIIKNLAAHPELDEFVVERPEPKAKVADVKPEPKVIDVTLPAEFLSYTNKKQYDFLRFVAKLTTEQAADVVAIERGLVQKSSDIFNITYAAPVEVAGDPIKEFISQRVLKAEADARRLEMDERAFALAHKPKPEPKVIEPVPVRTMEVSIPKPIFSIDPSQQYLYFTRELKMLPDEAIQLVASIGGMETPIVFKVTLED